MRYIQILPILILISACGQDINKETAQEPVRTEISEQPINEPVIVENKPVVPPVVDTITPSTPPTIPATPPDTPATPPDTPATPPTIDTGSTNPQLAQLHPRYFGPNYWAPAPIVSSIYGEDSKQEIKITISKPPKELSPCFNAAILNVKIPLMPEKYRYNSWWILASSSALYTWSETKTVYLYWATEAAKDEIGISPIKHELLPLDVNNPENIKINTGFATLPYQWINQLGHYSSLPQHQEELC